MITGFLGFLGEIVGIHANAMTTHQPGFEFQKIPFGSGGFQYRRGINIPSRLKIFASSLTKAILISRCEFSITLAASATLMVGCQMGAGLNNGSVQVVHLFCCFRSGTGSNLQNVGNGMEFITRINSFRGISAEKIDIEF